jgi:hypothetical protein
MAKNRELGKDVWYKVWTEVNVGEPLFRVPEAKTILNAALWDTKKRRKFEMRGLKIEGSWVSFYIKPDDGFKLPKIMQWLKQTFSLWFNEHTGRKGHTWGERYGSEIVYGELPEDAKAVDWATVVGAAKGEIPEAAIYTLSWVSPRPAGRGTKSSFSPEFRFSSEPPPG